jgi:hypothetical protein
MIGASIYGFVDYKQTHKKKEFKEMYTEETSTPVDVVIEKKNTEPADKKEIVSDTKKAVSKKPFKNPGAKEEEPLKGIVAISDDVKISNENKVIGDAGVSVKVSDNPGTEKKLVKKKKKLSTKIFSRAPIREEINFASEPEKKKGKE